MLSFSSSGVSSTGSLHLSTASEVEDVLELEPDMNSKLHISSTYICSNEPVTRNSSTEPNSVEVHGALHIHYKDKSHPPVNTVLFLLIFVI